MSYIVVSFWTKVEVKFDFDFFWKHLEKFGS